MEAIFKALADPARLTLMDSLRQKDGQSLSELEAQLDMSRFGVMKHLKLLEDASLIVTRKKGRFKYHYLNALPLQEAIDRWIDPYRAKPAARSVLDLKAKLEGAAPMSETQKPDFMMATFIRCTQDALWSALTDPQEVIQYHFMAKSAEGTLEQGGSATYQVDGGMPMLTIDVTEARPKTYLDMLFRPCWEGDGMPTSRCVYLIEPQGDHCKLTVEHYDIPPGQEGVADGWYRMIAGLKTWLETGEAHRFAMTEGG
ncbi:ArsR/SmtB family transcription factor [Ruegeria hyattellae]|uniref:ArsR/SmtB family transcription factor n=1 Tax=Ruegeria hyattellae TaxID=3233337 RepID=UPI00355BB027